MHAVLQWVETISTILCSIGFVLCLLFILPTTGYFLVRAALKFARIYSASPDRSRKDVQLAAFCGGLVVFTCFCWLCMTWSGIYLDTHVR